MSRLSNKAGKVSNRAIMPFCQDSAKTGFAGSPPRPLKKSSRYLDPRKNTTRETPQTILPTSLATKQSIDKGHDKENTDCAHNMTTAANCTCSYAR